MGEAADKVFDVVRIMNELEATYGVTRQEEKHQLFVKAAIRARVTVTERYFIQHLSSRDLSVGERQQLIDKERARYCKAINGAHKGTVEKRVHSSIQKLLALADQQLPIPGLKRQLEAQLSNGGDESKTEGA